MAISSLLRRLGFVKLDNFGLVLTPDDRIMSVRPTVLDDGLGGKIVGWQDGDLAATELQPWEPATRAKPPKLPQMMPRAKAPTAPPPIPRPLPGVAAMAAPPMIQAMAVAQPLGAAPPRTKRPPTPIPLETHPMERVEDPAELGEDDEWEWEIAVARARAQAEWAAEAIAAAPPATKKKRATSPIAIVAEPKPVLNDAWSPNTEPLMETWEPTSNSEPVRVMARPKSPTPAKPIVITTPKRPQTNPVVRAARAAVNAAPAVGGSTLKQREPLQRDPKQPITQNVAPRRFPRATPETTPYGNLGEDTQVNYAPANDVGEKTRPGLLLPSASTTRRVAAKQR